MDVLLISVFSLLKIFPEILICFQIWHPDSKDYGSWANNWEQVVHSRWVYCTMSPRHAVWKILCWFWFRQAQDVLTEAGSCVGQKNECERSGGVLMWDQLRELFFLEDSERCSTNYDDTTSQASRQFILCQLMKINRRAWDALPNIPTIRRLRWKENILDQ